MCTIGTRNTVGLMKFWLDTIILYLLPNTILTDEKKATFESQKSRIIKQDLATDITSSEVHLKFISWTAFLKPIVRVYVRVQYTVQFSQGVHPYTREGHTHT